MYIEIIMVTKNSDIIKRITVSVVRKLLKKVSLVNS